MSPTSYQLLYPAIWCCEGKNIFITFVGKLKLFMKKYSLEDFKAAFKDTVPEENHSEETNTATEQDALPPKPQTIHLYIERKHRGGKTVTLLRNIQGSEAQLEQLSKWLKTQCGGGGSLKDGEILLQGEHREKVKNLLEKQGYKTKLC
ncbi:MAG: translation initiation factor [Sphingobacteriales bacterium]|nr:translation initiation factor [Sphingobacteriales bacterium]